MKMFQPNIKSKTINNDCLYAIQETEDDLGFDGTVELLTHALPLIVERKKLIDSALDESDFASAATYAHKTLGSIRIYGSSELERLLILLKTRQVTEARLSDFHSEITEEFDSVYFTISEWLLLGNKSV